MAIPEADEAYIVSAFQEGMSFFDIAERSGYSEGTARAIIKKRGLVRPDIRTRTVTDAQAMRWLQLRQSGVTVRDIARDVGVGHMTVYKHICRMGWKGWKTVMPRGPQMPQAHLDMIINLRRQGLSFNKIAKQLGYERNRVGLAYRTLTAKKI